MILIIDVCAEPMHSDEFAKPVAALVPGCVLKNYKQLVREDIAAADAIIICGTALKDNEFMEHLKVFEWLNTTGKPVLGICAGMQIMASLFGASLEPSTEIGMIGIKVTKKGTLLGDGEFQAYELHNFAPRLPKDFLAVASSETCVQAFAHKQKPLFGVLFHPEVRNKGIITKFCGNV